MRPNLTVDLSLIILTYPILLKKLFPVIGLGFICAYLLACESQNQYQAEIHHEKYRPQVHFSPDSMWMNDPNGMVYVDGVYHLFFQHYPDSTVWGPMHWGHATSTDLMHWEQQDIALFPDSLGYIFSGSAVYDKQNSSGLGSKENPPLVAIYTYHSDKKAREGRSDHQTQALAYSLDKGKSWQKYANNPVLGNPDSKHDFRDPKVFWYENTQEWIMILAVGNHMEFYGSKNLIDWAYKSSFGEAYGAHGGVWECPDLFPLKVENSEKTKWVMLVSINPGGLHGGSATQYFIGDFNGTRFTTNQGDTRWLDYGKDNYAGVTWAQNPGKRKIFLGWMSNWQYAQEVPTKEWRSAMTFPRELGLRETDDGLKVTSKPISEIKDIEKREVDVTSQLVDGHYSLSGQTPFVVNPSYIELDFSQFADSTIFGVELRNARGQMVHIGYDVAAKQFFIDRRNSGTEAFSEHFYEVHKAPRFSTNADELKISLLIDRASVELFADGGEVVMTDIFFPDEYFTELSIFTENGTVFLEDSEIYELISIW